MTALLRRIMLAMALTLSAAPAYADALKIVALGASNTWGWGVRKQQTFAARLPVLLRLRGIDATVANAGVVATTTGNMLRRADRAAPDGTDIVVLQPGSNDRRFSLSPAQRAANIAAIVERLRSRNIRVIVYDEPIPPNLLQWDGIHYTAAAHEKIAATLAEQIVSEFANKQP